MSGMTRLGSFLPETIPSTSLILTSNSPKIGATDATLTIEMTTVSGLLQKGILQIKSPPWYLKESIRQEGVLEDYYADSLISFDSKATIDAPVKINVEQC